MTRRRRASRARLTETAGVAGVLRRRRGGNDARSGIVGDYVVADARGVVVPGLHMSPTPQLFRDGEYVHVSDLLYRCTRQMALSDALGVPITPERIFDGRGITFAQGRSIQEFVTERLKKNMAANLFGKWSCVCGFSQVEDTYTEALKRPRCRRCRAKLLNYGELVTHNDQYMIVGSIDLAFLFDLYLYLVEIKSINANDFAALRRPIPDHLMQAVMYWYLMREAGWSLANKLSILYVAKEFRIGSPYQEFVVEPEEHLDRLDCYLDDATALKNHAADGALPARTVCTSVNSPAAKKCPLALQCFAMGDEVDQNIPTRRSRSRTRPVIDQHRVLVPRRRRR